MLHRSRRIVPWAALALAFAWSASALAQSPFDFEVTETEVKKDDAAKVEVPKPDFPSIADTTKEFEKIDGYFPLYKKGEELYMVLDSSKRDKLFLLAISIAGGPAFAGFQWDDMSVKWERLEKNILLVRPNLNHRVKEGTPLASVVQRTFTSSILLAVPILAMDGDTALIDLQWVFKQDFAQLSGLLGMVVGGGYQMRSDLSKWVVNKGFPSNTEIAVEAAFMGGGFGGGMFGGGGGDIADSRGLRMRVHYSLSEIPENGYTAREADDRVGYFLTAIKDYNKPYDSRGMFHRYVNRWGLQKLDPELEVSPPVKPIVFYIEKTVPVQYRKHIKEGIEEWNRAFEKIGFVDAIIVRQQTETNEFKDLDPEDVRYNFFRWITSGSPFAMGPSRVNPLTGEILDADILMDDSYVRFMMDDHRTFAGSTAAMLLDDEKFDAFLRSNPRLDPTARNAQELAGIARDLDLSPVRNAKVLEVFRARGRNLCTYAQGKARQMAVAHAIAWVQNGAGGGKIPQEFIGEFIKDTVMHEVGHTLGLRHNFKASSWRTLEEINTETRPGDVSGSVMDYNAVNWAATGKTQGHYACTTIGPYDFWAIEFGYRTEPPKPKEGETALDEAGMLKQILSRVAEKGLAYATDEETSFLDPDPLANRWDLGADPLAFAKSRAELVNGLLKDLPNRMTADGGDYHLARKAFNALLFERFFSAFTALRHVSGQYVHRDHKGDANARAPFVVVPAAKQREALQFIVDQVLAESAWQFDPQTLNYLAPGRWGHWDSDEFDFRLDFPTHDTINRFQTLTFSLLYNPWTLKRMHDAELKVPAGEDTVTVPEMFQGIRKAVWSELDRPGLDSGAWTERKPMISSIRRMLQREHLEFVVTMALGPAWQAMMPADVGALAWDNLRELSADIDRVLAAANNVDGYSRAHLRDTRARIEEALKARYSR